MNMESITVSADYSTGEILQKAGLNTILGMGTVFVVLIFLSFVIYLLKFIRYWRKNSGEAQKLNRWLKLRRRLRHRPQQNRWLKPRMIRNLQQ